MPLRDWFRAARPLSDEEFAQRRDELLRETPVPLLWLFGKTGSGKTSIIRHLTGASDAEIGSGFRPQTQSTRLFEFPAEGPPLLRFLDTRGLGEAGYDPQHEIDKLSLSAHLLIVTVRVMDHALAEIVDQVRAIRRSAPDRPVLLALTCLHDAYPGQQHPLPDLFDGVAGDFSSLPEAVPADLQRSLEAQQRRFDGLVDRIVPIDLTLPEEGFHEPNFGEARLKRAIVELLPHAYRQSLLRFEEIRTALKELHLRRTGPVILGYSSLAASAAAVPVPWIDIPLVMGLQTRLIYRLAALHQQTIDAATIAKVSGALGGRIALRMGIRELLKAIPWAGSALNAAAAFAYTYATGVAWNWYFTEVKGGHVPASAELQGVFSEQLKRGAALWNVAGTAKEPAASAPAAPSEPPVSGAAANRSSG